MNIINNFENIKKEISLLNSKCRLIVVTKTRAVSDISNFLKIGHQDFGENRVQEAENKWSEIVSQSTNIKLHLLGTLQSNKVKKAHQLFHYIHTLDNEKLADSFSIIETNSLRKLKYFIQVNIGNELQKGGISISSLPLFLKYCKGKRNLNVVGLMCIPPVNMPAEEHFIKLKKLAYENQLPELSMGMSNDYKSAVKNGASFVRIGSKIFRSD